MMSGPDSQALDNALSQLELLVAVDLVQRDSHRHAHWLIPGTHFLEREGCTACQGYLLCPPLPAAEFEQWLRNRARIGAKKKPKKKTRAM